MVLRPEEREALDHLIPPERQIGDELADLTDAARVALDRRERNTRDGGAVIAALHRTVQSWREIERLTGIPVSTARRWAAPVGELDPPDDSA